MLSFITFIIVVSSTCGLLVIRPVNYYCGFQSDFVGDTIS
jgi:hypothetical protein